MKTGLLINGSVRTAGVTFYTRQGLTVVRSSSSIQPLRRTRAQFDVRMRTRHSVALWRELKCAGRTLFGGTSAYDYGRFRSLAFALPVVYLRRGEGDCSLLLPGMPVSEGSLPPLHLALGSVGGTAALLSDLRTTDLRPSERLVLCRARQDVDFGKPRCHISVGEVSVGDFDVVDGCLALVGTEFGDPMGGWALVRVAGDDGGATWRCSSQRLVTRCTYYRNFTTDEAFVSAVGSFGGLKGG